MNTASGWYTVNGNDWYIFPEPFDWAKHGLIVLGDRYLPCGKRQHVVRGTVAPGLELDNADIFGEDEPNWVAQQNGLNL